jgi:hypothetical protein
MAIIEMGLRHGVEVVDQDVGVWQRLHRSLRSFF